MTVRRYRGTEMLWRSSTPATPLECTLTKNGLVSPLECALTKSLDLKSLGITLFQKGGGGGGKTELSVTASSSGSGRGASSSGWRALRQTCAGCRESCSPWFVDRAPSGPESRWRASHGVWRGKGFRGQSRSARCAAAQRRCARVRGRRL